MNIKIFRNKIIREPLFPLRNYLEIPKTKESLEEFIKTLFFNHRFRDAVFLSSPELFYEWEKLVLYMNKGGKKITYSLLKFYIRSISNTVPFGLFATYSLLDNFKEEEPEYTRFSSIDIEYLSKLIYHLNKNPLIRRISTYRLNNTFYEIGEKYRYIEPNIINSKLSYTLASIEADDVIKLLLEYLEYNFSYNEIFEILKQNIDDIDENMIHEFIDELIESKFILNELDICLNENDLLSQIISSLEKNITFIKNNDYLYNIYINLVNIKGSLSEIDKNIFCNKDNYETVYKYLDNIGIEYNKKFIINSNIRKNSIKISINNHDTKIKEITNVVKKLSNNSKYENKNLLEFKERFYNRYEEQEVPLLEVFDNELGIGYLSSLNEQMIFSDLIDDIATNSFAKKGRKQIHIESELFSFWLDKFLRDDTVIDLSQEDLSIFKESKLKMGTISFSYSFIGNKFVLKQIGEYSGSVLLGRFSNTDMKIKKIIDDISDFEHNCFKNELSAEIIHLPNNRAGNILVRNVKRQREISILSKNSKNSHNILLEDIMISIRENKIILKSKKENKEIIPFLTSAQNYHFDSLPIYQFLCDLQSQYRGHYLGVNFGGLDLNNFEHTPRIIYGKDIILFKETWRISKERLKNKLKNYKAENISIEDFRKYLNILNVCRYIYLTEEGEDKLIIDTHNDIILEILFDEFLKKDSLIITECIYQIDNCLENIFSNEIIAQIGIKNNILKKEYDENILNNQKTINRKLILGGEWIYMKLYTGYITSISILINEINRLKETLLNENFIDKWFYIRYNDPEFHLRIRFRVVDRNKYSEIIKFIHDVLASLVKSKQIWKIDFSDYNRELERYNWNDIEKAESIFFIDSEFSLNLLKYFQNISNGWIFILKSLDDMLTAFNFNLEQKHKTIENMYKSFAKEFNINKVVKKNIDKKFRTFEKEINSIFTSLPLDIVNIFEKRKKEISEITFNVDEVVLNNLVWSFIHMHVNRIVKSNPRFHELVIYGLLEKFYRKQIGKSNETYKTI